MLKNTLRYKLNFERYLKIINEKQFETQAFFFQTTTLQFLKHATQN